MRTLFFTPGCPFAQRTRALLRLLQVELTLREVDLRRGDPELRAKSPTGKVPLLVEGDAVLYESWVINDYLSDTREWVEAYAEDPLLKARQRLAMKQWDDVILPLTYYRAIRFWPFGRLLPAERRAVRRELDELEQTAASTPPRSLLGLHCAPFWARIRWLGLPVAREVSARPRLRAWLDEGIELDVIQSTLPDKARVVGRVRRSQQLFIVALVIGLAIGFARSYL